MPKMIRSINPTEHQTKAGVYRIYCIVSNKNYIGSSYYIKKRIGKHKIMLKKGFHHSHKLQKDWDKYGEENFLFHVLESVTEKKSRIKRETYWINYYNSHMNGYN